MIGILVIAHDTLGDSLVRAVTHVLGTRPPQFDSMSVRGTDDPLDLVPAARALIAKLDTGEGVLILTDIYGASPASAFRCSCARSPTAGAAWRRS
jgi:PTS system ascorbate-specific IIA component